MNPNPRRGLPTITSTIPMTAMQQMPAAMPGSPMSYTMPMSMTMPTASGGMCQDGKCDTMSDMMQGMMEMMHAMMAGGAMTSDHTHEHDALWRYDDAARHDGA